MEADPHETQVYHSFATQVAAAHSSNVPRSPHIAEVIHKLSVSTSRAPAEAYRGRPLPPILTPRKRKVKGTRDDAAKEKNQAEAPTHTRTTSRPHDHVHIRPHDPNHFPTTEYIAPRNAHSSASAHLPHSHPRAPHGYSSAPWASGTPHRARRPLQQPYTHHPPPSPHPHAPAVLRLGPSASRCAARARARHCSR
ncbi:hypothetical protein B0H13DRAFT_2063116, partial [Mycena leptocephala]